MNQKMYSILKSDYEEDLKEAPFSLLKADQSTYSKYFATYRKNIWFRPSWLFIQKMLLEACDCYWVIQDNKRIAGISLEDNTIGSLFFIPPFDSLSVNLVSFLRDYVLEISADKNRVDAYNVLPEHMGVFESVGFNLVSTRKCMIRPTEKISISALNEFICVRPEPEYVSKMILLMEEAYSGGAEERDLDIYRRDLTYYLEHNKQEHLLDASSILIHKETNEIIALCLVSLWEEIPLIYEIAVKSTYCNQGIGRYMLCKAINHLESDYEVIRLFVTSGNNAEYLYSSVGFLSGEETSHLVFRVKEK